MVLVLWSPVAVPLLPTLVRAWTTNSSSRIAELFCIGGLYTAIMILVMLWGRRIRGYEDALEQYGLDLTSSQKVCFRAKSARRNLDVGSLACYTEDVYVVHISTCFSVKTTTVLSCLSISGQT